MKKTRILLFCTMALMLLFASCSDDSSEFFPAGFPNENNGSDSGGIIGGGSSGGNNGGGSTNDPIAQNVRNHVTSSITYNSTRLYYDVSITSTLEGVYPNKNITYGVEYGYGNTYCYYKTKKKQYGSIRFLVPVGNAYPATGNAGFAFWQYEGWQFSVWDWVQQYGSGTYPSSIFTLQEHYNFMFYLGSIYTVLYRKYEQGEVWESDNDLYQSAWNEIKGKYYNVKNSLCSRAFVLVDGVKYVIE